MCYQAAPDLKSLRSIDVRYRNKSKGREGGVEDGMVLSGVEGFR